MQARQTQLRDNGEALFCVGDHFKQCRLMQWSVFVFPWKLCLWDALRDPVQHARNLPVHRTPFLTLPPLNLISLNLLLQHWCLTWFNQITHHLYSYNLSGRVAVIQYKTCAWITIISTWTVSYLALVSNARNEEQRSHYSTAEDPGVSTKYIQ